MDFINLMMIKLLLIVRYKFGYMVPNSESCRGGVGCHAGGVSCRGGSCRGGVGWVM